MKNKKYVNSSIVLLFVVLFSFPSLAQVEEEKGSLYQHRYWHYRGRVKNDFMLGTGDKPGESFVLGNRVGDHITGGENPSGPLSHYIGVLAMEYYLLKKNNQDYTETVRDLYYSLYTINRLDLESANYEWYGDDIGHDECQPQKGIVDSISEQYSKKGCVGIVRKGNSVGEEKDVLNGFFIRDDIYSLNEDGDPIRFAFDDEKTPELFNRINNSNNLYPITKGKIGSQFMSHKEKYPMSGNNSKYIKIEESQDEVVYYMWALALVIKYLDEDISFNNKKFQDGEVSIKNEAKAIVDRMVSWFATCPPEYNCATPHWFFRIVNPNTDKFVNDGCWSAGMSWGFYKATKAMGIELEGLWPYSPIAQAYKDLWMNEYIWPTQFSNDWIHKMICTLAAIGDSWNIIGYPNRTMDVLENYVETQDRGFQYDTFILYHYILHGNYYDEYIKDKMNYYQNILRNAPCSIMEGNYFEKDPTLFHPAESFEWSGGARLTSPEDRGRLGWNFDSHHYYSGLDYMFLMNMFFIAYGDVLNLSLSNQSNTIAYANNNYIQRDYPDEGIGSYEYPKVFKGFDEVISNKVIDTDGNVNFIAQNRIVLKPGFKALKGSSFKANIDPVESHYYNCIPPIPTPESEIYVSNSKVEFNEVEDYEWDLKFKYVKGATEAYSYLIAKRKKDGEWNWSKIAKDKWVAPILIPSKKVEFHFKDKDKYPNMGKFYTYTTFFKKGEHTHKIHFGKFEAKKGNSKDLLNTLVLTEDAITGALIDSTKTSLQSINILPNPNTGSFKLLVLNDKVDSYNLKILDALGSIVFQENAIPIGIKEVDIREKNAGIYIATIIIGGEVFTKKIIKK